MHASPFSSSLISLMVSVHVWYAQLDASGIFHVFIYEWLFTRMFICCCNLMFYDWSECVMSVLGTTKHLLTLGNKVILYYIVLSPWQLNISPHPSQPTHVSSFHFHSLSIQKHTWSEEEDLSVLTINNNRSQVIHIILTCTQSPFISKDQP